MALLHKLTKELHKEFWESGALSLDREQTLSLLELVKELAIEVENLMVDTVRKPTETKV